MKTQILILATVLALVFASCQSDSDVIEPTINQDKLEKSTQIAFNEVAVENAVEAADYDLDILLKMVAQNRSKGGRVLEWKKGMRYQIGQCPDVVIDSTDGGYPVTITCDYGEGTELENGRVLAGIVTVVISDQQGVDGATKTVRYTNFAVDTIAVEGTCVHAFIGNNVDSRQMIWESHLQFTLPDGTVIDRDGTRTRTWAEGLETIEDRSDDMIEITGDVLASDNNGASYSKAITTPLIRLGDCKYHVQGVVTITENGVVTSTLNFGDGECDNIAILTIDGVEQEIDLSSRGHKGKGKHREGGKRK